MADTLIFYFSGAGNSKYVAEKLAERLGGKAVNLVDYSGVVDSDCVGFVTGCYCNDIPHKAKELLEKLTIERADYLFSVTTSQASDGFSAVTVGKILDEKGYKLNYAGHVGMLSTFVVTVAPIVKTTENHYTSNENKEIINIALDVRNRITREIKCAFLPVKEVVSKFDYFAFENILKLNKKSVTSSCIGCGKCAELCPNNNINIVDGRAVFGNDCTYCYGCAHVCPMGAVKFGNNNINKKKQYKRFF